MGNSLNSKIDFFQDLNTVMKDYSAETPVLDLAVIMKDLYLTEEQAKIWTGMTAGDNLELVLELIESGRERLFPDVRSVADYGCGDGHKSSKVYRLLNGDSDEGTLNLIDYSDPILNTAYNNCRIKGKVPERKLHKHRSLDLLKMGNIFADDEDDSRLHLFLGQTIGNFEKKKRDRILKNIVAIMSEGEYLALEWEWNEPQDYDNDKTKEFINAFNKGLGIPERAAGNIKVDLGEDENGEEANIISYVVQKNQDTSDGSWEVVTGINKDQIYTLYSGTEVIVAKSRRFKHDQVKSLLEEHGLEEKLTVDPIENKRGIIFEKVQDMQKINEQTKAEKKYGKAKSTLLTVAALGVLVVSGLWYTLGGDYNDSSKDARPVVEEEVDTTPRQPLDIIAGGDDDVIKKDPSVSGFGYKPTMKSSLKTSEHIDTIEMNYKSTAFPERLRTECEQGMINGGLLECPGNDLLHRLELWHTHSFTVKEVTESKDDKPGKKLYCLVSNYFDGSNNESDEFLFEEDDPKGLEDALNKLLKQNENVQIFSDTYSGLFKDILYHIGTNTILSTNVKIRPYVLDNTLHYEIEGNRIICKSFDNWGQPDKDLCSHTPIKEVAFNIDTQNITGVTTRPDEENPDYKIIEITQSDTEPVTVSLPIESADELEKLLSPEQSKDVSLIELSWEDIITENTKIGKIKATLESVCEYTTGEYDEEEDYLSAVVQPYKHDGKTYLRMRCLRETCYKEGFELDGESIGCEHDPILNEAMYLDTRFISKITVIPEELFGGDLRIKQVIPEDEQVKEYRSQQLLLNENLSGEFGGYIPLELAKKFKELLEPYLDQDKQEKVEKEQQKETYKGLIFPNIDKDGVRVLFFEKEERLEELLKKFYSGARVVAGDFTSEFIVDEITTKKLYNLENVVDVEVKYDETNSPKLRIRTVVDKTPHNDERNYKKAEVGNGFDEVVNYLMEHSRKHSWGLEDEDVKELEDHKLLEDISNEVYTKSGDDQLKFKRLLTEYLRDNLLQYLVKTHNLELANLDHKSFVVEYLIGHTVEVKKKEVESTVCTMTQLAQYAMSNPEELIDPVGVSGLPIVLGPEIFFQCVDEFMEKLPEERQELLRKMGCPLPKEYLESDDYDVDSGKDLLGFEIRAIDYVTMEVMGQFRVFYDVNDPEKDAAKTLFGNIGLIIANNSGENLPSESNPDLCEKEKTFPYQKQIWWGSKKLLAVSNDIEDAYIQANPELSNEENEEIMKKIADILRTKIGKGEKMDNFQIGSVYIDQWDNGVVDNLDIFDHDIETPSRSMDEIIQDICKISPVDIFGVGECEYSRREYVESNGSTHYEIKAKRTKLLKFAYMGTGPDKIIPCSANCLGFYLDTKYLESATITPVKGIEINDSVNLTITHNFKWSKPSKEKLKFEDKTYFMSTQDAEVIMDFLKPWIKTEYEKKSIPVAHTSIN
jgi:uncharacterized SAM-dependent methyltransferase